jgi:hypothetical protein
LLLLQARKYLVANRTGTVTIARAMMGRWRKEGNRRKRRKQILRSRLQQKRR